MHLVCHSAEIAELLSTMSSIKLDGVIVIVAGIGHGDTS